MSHTPHEHTSTAPYDWAADPAAFDTTPETANAPGGSPLEQLLDKLHVLAGRGENTGEAKHLISDLKGSTFLMRGCEYRIVSIRHDAAGEPLVGAEAMGENARTGGLQFYTIQDIEAARTVDAEVAQARQARLVRDWNRAATSQHPQEVYDEPIVRTPSRTKALVDRLADRLAAANQRLREAYEAEAANPEPVDEAPQRESWHSRATRIARRFGRGGAVAVSPETVTLASEESAEGEPLAQDDLLPLPAPKTEAEARLDAMEAARLGILAKRNQAEGSQPDTQPETDNPSSLPQQVPSNVEPGFSQVGEKPAVTPIYHSAFEMPFYVGTVDPNTDEEQRAVDATETEATRTVHP